MRVCFISVENFAMSVTKMGFGETEATVIEKKSHQTVRQCC